MCIIIWVSGEKFEQEQGRIHQNRYDRLVSKFSSARRPSPPESEQDLVVKIHQNYVHASKRPDSLSLPSYAGYRKNRKRQKMDEEKEIDKVEVTAIVEG